MFSKLYTVTCAIMFSMQLNIPYGIHYFSALSAIQEFTVKKMISNYFHAIDKTE